MVGLALGCLFLLGVLVAGGLGVWWWATREGGSPLASGSPTPTPTSTSTAAPTSTPTTATASAGLEALAGAWVVDAQDDNYDTSDPAANRAEFGLEGGRLVARPPSGEGEIRLTRRDGDDLSGEYVEGKDSKPLTGRVDGDRMVLTVEGDSVTLVRGDAVAAAPEASPTVEAPPTSDPEPGWEPDPPQPSLPGHPVFEDRGDLDGDGVEERVLVVAETEAGAADPMAAEPRRLVVVKPDGTVVFQTDTFKEPFRVDFNHLADVPHNEAGVHVVAGSGPYPDIRLVFASASGNFGVFRYDGSTYVLVETGD